ncbi:MAG: hypothetical protein A2X35_01700 [Elusimicrobia bacterium GWA2_61_42]|nr:MAG: hypothetical protein A2X35_01700 [Elusimicrobia bacterium GWA2_61_42]OGR76860.1 MAG: hypothetical protein A2X38_11875 [Elusimicrobia bacterium GWC2_61_25]
MRTITAVIFFTFLAPLLPLTAAAAPGESAAAVQLLGSSGQAAPAPEPAAPKAVKAARPAAPEDWQALCAPPAPSEEIIYQSDFRWDYTLPEMLARFEEVYASPKRLDKRAYWDQAAGSLVLPPSYEGAPVKIGQPLVQALRRHIERALELGYADAVFFPDMGHSHLLVPDALWEKKYDKYPASEYSRMYEDMLGDPAIQIFYHTAEQLKILQDKQPINDAQLLFRRANRNIAGFIKPDAELFVYQNPESDANTVHEVPGYRWWGAGFNFSAQKDGCFTYVRKGRTYRFDISLHDLPMKPGSGEDWQ